MIEYYLPEEMIRLLHRPQKGSRTEVNNVDNEAPNQQNTLENRLRALMIFLQNEMEHKQKINLAT